MVKLIKRMRHLRNLLDIRLGPGAAILPPDISRLHMTFALKEEGGHLGARYFWRRLLPRLKYHNPAVQMTIFRSENQAGPATLTVHYAPPASSLPESAVTSASPEGEAKKPFAINIKHKNESEILAKLIEATQAKLVQPSPEEVLDLRDREEFKRKTQLQREQKALIVGQRDREKELFKQAMGGS